ncbi:MAG: TatD family hydrolase [Clostridiales bacterium]|nr:TatD family hydrolase [Clostridiales bacterium]
MVIDFHTHIFPENVSGHAVTKLEQSGKLKAYTDATVDGLLYSMREAGIDLSVLLPVVTRLEQFDTVNRYAVKWNRLPGICSFGGIHPKDPNCRYHLKEISRMGLKGIKLHPDFQQTYIDDISYIRLISQALDEGLYIAIHAGLDAAYPDCIHATPERICHMLNETGILGSHSKEMRKIILAHMGGFACWDQVSELLSTEEVYVDTSFAFDYLPEEKFVELIKKHGSDRVLFGTDSPWQSQKESLQKFQMLPLSSEEKENILYKNAWSILGS